MMYKQRNPSALAMALGTPSTGPLSGCPSLGGNSLSTAPTAPTGVGARLDNRWVLWCDRWDDNGSGTMQTLLQIGAATRATDFWNLVTRTSLGGLEPNCSFQVFKSEVRPEWEDPANIQGGHFRISVSAPSMESDAHSRTAEAKLWFNLLVSVVGSRFLLSSSINGIGVTRKRQGCVISLWIDTADPSVVRTVRREVQEQLPAGSFVVRFIAHALLSQTSHTTHVQVALDHRRTHSAPTRFISLELDPVPQIPVAAPGDIVVVSEEAASLSAAALMSRSVAQPNAATGVLQAMCTAIAAPHPDALTSGGSSPACPTLPSHCSTGSQRTRQHHPYAGGFIQSMSMPGAMQPPHWRSKSDTHAKTTVPDTAATLGRYAYGPPAHLQFATQVGSPPVDPHGPVTYMGPPNEYVQYPPPPQPHMNGFSPHGQKQQVYPPAQVYPPFGAGRGPAAPMPMPMPMPYPMPLQPQVGPHVEQPPACPVHGVPGAPRFAPQQLAHAAMSQGTWHYSGGAEVPFAQPVQPVHPVPPHHGHKAQSQSPPAATGTFRGPIPTPTAVEQPPPPPPSAPTTACVAVKEPPQQTKSDAPMFICRGWLFPAGLNRKERRRIQFAEDVKALEEFPGATFVGLQHADGPCSEDLTPLEPRREDQ